MTRQSLLTTLRDLARARPAFHSEADFKHELAWRLRSTGAAEGIRLERPFDVDGRRIKLDILAICNGEGVGLELKYWTRGADFIVNGEHFQPSDQAAQDLSRYDFWKDVDRLERLAKLGQVRRGFSVALTNDPNYWRESHRGTIDASFRLHDQRSVRGRLAWSPGTAPGTMKGREKVLSLRCAYRLAWTDYSMPQSDQLFRVLVVGVTR